jgi:hypothetical protein
MNDTPAKTKSSKRPGGQCAPSSPESRWIGFLVLGFGLMAVIAVGLLFMAQKAPPAQESPAPAVDSVSPAPQATAGKQNLTDSLQAIGTARKEEDETPALGKADARSIEGVWEARLNDGKAVIELKGGSYRLITDSNDEVSRQRYFSSGGYKVIEGGVLVLTPSADAAAPEDDYTYNPIYLGEIPVVIGLREGRMVWLAPGPEVRIFVPTIHPFLRLAPDGVAVWSPL